MWLLLDMWVLQLHVYPRPQSTPQAHTRAWGGGSHVLHPILTVLQMDAGYLELPGERMCHRSHVGVSDLVWLLLCSTSKIPLHDRNFSCCFYTSFQGDSSFSQKFLGNLLVILSKFIVNFLLALWFFRQIPPRNRWFWVCCSQALLHSCSHHISCCLSRLLPRGCSADSPPTM